MTDQELAKEMARRLVARNGEALARFKLRVHVAYLEKKDYSDPFLPTWKAALEVVEEMAAA